MAKPLVLFEGSRFRVEQVMRNRTRRNRSTPSRSCGIRGRSSCCRCWTTAASVSFENYRASVEQTLIELPAGTREPGEDPAETARRELAEETGYRAGPSSRWPRFTCRRASSTNAWSSTWRRVGAGPAVAGRRRRHPAAAEHVVRSIGHGRRRPHLRRQDHVGAAVLSGLRPPIAP